MVLVVLVALVVVVVLAVLVVLVVLLVLAVLVKIGLDTILGPGGSQPALHWVGCFAVAAVAALVAAFEIF